jgi:hypothetical protein
VNDKTYLSLVMRACVIATTPLSPSARLSFNNRYARGQAVIEDDADTDEDAAADADSGGAEAIASRCLARTSAAESVKRMLLRLTNCVDTNVHTDADI